MSLRHFKQWNSVHRLLGGVSRAEHWWFDVLRGVHTATPHTLKGLTLDGAIDGAAMYIPVRAASARAALRELPIDDHRDYTFVDIGSGRGKALFIAAEYPFRRIIGVEFARELHYDAVRNISKYRSWRRRCRRIDSVHMNALDFEFPDENLVLFFFNPFLPAIMRQLLLRLGASLDRRPREVLLVLVYPELEPVLDQSPWLRRIAANRRFLIYRASGGGDA